MLAVGLVPTFLPQDVEKEGPPLPCPLGMALRL
jgi:hypothetical protein